MMRSAHILTPALLLTGCCRTPQGPSSDERETYLLHEGLYRVASLSLKVLRDTDPGDPAVLSLRSGARAHLLVYSKEVEELSGQYD